jgi:nucleoside 2-deoxyribosyltransferase
MSYYKENQHDLFLKRWFKGGKMRPEKPWAHVDDHDFYIAGPLFSQAEKDFNFALYTDLSIRGFKCFLPQLTETGDTDYVFKKNLVHLMNSRMVVAICDGTDVDSGTSWECGKFHGTGKIYALRTDLRKTGDDPASGINLMIGRSVDIIFTDTMTMIDYLVETYNGVKI